MRLSDDPGLARPSLPGYGGGVSARVCLIAAVVALGLLPSAALGRSLSLGEALLLAEEHDDRLDITRADADASSARALQETARALPTVQVGAGITQNPKEISTGGRVISPLTQPQGNAVARVTLFDGPSVPGAFAGWQEHAAGQLERTEARDALRADVADLYLALAEAQALEVAQLRAKETAEELLRMAEARVRFDQGVPLEVEEAKAEVLRATADVERTRGTVRQVAALLALRLGLPLDERLEAFCEGCLHPPAGLTGSADISLPLPYRQDLQGLKLRSDAAGLRTVGSWLDFLPELAVVGNMRLQEPTLFNPEPLWWTAQVVVSWTLFEGGGRWGRTSERLALERRAKLQEGLATREAEVAVHQATSAIDAAAAADEAARARAEVAESALHQAQLRYREGLLSSFGVSEAARRKADADAQAVQGRFSVYRATLRLRRALGLGVMDEGEQGS